MNTAFQVVGNALPCFIPARIQKTKIRGSSLSFRALTENIPKSLAWARKELDVSTMEHFGVAFIGGLGIHADLLMEIAKTASDPVIEFNLFPKGIPGKESFLAENPVLLLTHSNTKQYLRLRNLSKDGRAPIVFDFENRPDENKYDPWINKAVNQDRNLFEARLWQHKNHGNFAADGIRIHLDFGLEKIEHKGIEIPDVAYELMDAVRKSKSPPATFESVALQQAVKTARAYSKDQVTLKLRRRSIDVGANSIEHGKGFSRAKAKYAGKDASILVNPKFLLEALSGMNGEVTLRTCKPKILDKKWDAPIIWLKCGNREALIMTMVKG